MRHNSSSSSPRTRRLPVPDPVSCVEKSPAERLAAETQVDPTRHRAEATVPAPLPSRTSLLPTPPHPTPAAAENECRMTREEGAQSRNERVRDQAHNLNRFPARRAVRANMISFTRNPLYPPRHSCYAARDRCLLPDFSPRRESDRMIRPAPRA